jgi:hypothetical protein
MRVAVAPDKRRIEAPAAFWRPGVAVFVFSARVLYMLLVEDSPDSLAMTRFFCDRRGQTKFAPED